MLKADLHIHSIGSGHGYSTITENAEAAFERGLELIAITDHGPAIPSGAHMWFFWNLHHVPGIYKGMYILKGCEANLVPCGEKYNSSWGLDLGDIVCQRLDYVQFGFHPTTGFDTRDKEMNTAAVVRAMESPWVDQFNHPGNIFEFPLDVDTVIEAAVKNNVVIELNNSSLNPLGVRGESSDWELDFAARAYVAGAPLSLGSDAHYASVIGTFEPGLSLAAERGIPEEYFVNRDAASVIDFILAKRPRPLYSSCAETLPKGMFK